MVSLDCSSGLARALSTFSQLSHGPPVLTSMRSLRAALPLIVALGLCLVASTSASGKTHPTKAACATPAGYLVLAHDADAAIFRTRLTQATPESPEIYRYCVRSNGKKFPILIQEPVNADEPYNQVLRVQLAGDYAAYLEAFGAPGAPIPAPEEVNVVNLKTGKNIKVPSPSLFSSDTYFPGCCISLALSPTGVFAGIDRGYTPENDGSPVEDQVIAYQASTGALTVLATGAAGTLTNVQIFECAAGCSSTTTSVIGWRSNGIHEDASLPASG